MFEQFFLKIDDILHKDAGCSSEPDYTKKRYTIYFQYLIFLAIVVVGNHCLAAKPDTIPPRYKVTLNEAHAGDIATDTRLLDSYGLLPENIRAFYLSARTVFEGNAEADFTHTEIIEAARNNSIPLMGGPMLGNLSAGGVTLWMRSSNTNPLVVKVKKTDAPDEKSYIVNPEGAGLELRIMIDGLDSSTGYQYSIYSENKRIAEGVFTTAPESGEKGIFRLAFGSCFHKIGLHNPNLISQILEREPQSMMLLGDIAVDDRRNRINLHRADYLLRDVSGPWRKLAANVPLYTAWDDHDYFDNDLGGIPKGFTEADRASVRAVWQQNWNNPENPEPGIYFNTRIGPVEVIMLDTRSFRDNGSRGEYGSFLGRGQLTG
jgi:alkaline phosphatase D